ncbi:class I SAM-dependent methyltransferase [Roseovarius sp.]|uniref:class I SAM-dependent methyltransferase n=1 Tax=Roseovarius sp. TaxID=1486281 RepID=UPI003A97D727
MSVSKQSSETMVATTTHEFFAPATIKPLFWRPRFRASSPVQLHAPLLLWLAADARVRQVGVLGVGDGFAHFLFCQAIDKLNIQGRCTGFGFWKDQKTGAALAQPPSLLTEHAEQFYEDISDIRPFLNSTDAVENIAEQSLDLLFVDLNALAEGDHPHIEELIRRLRSNAILIVHATNALWQGAEHSAALAKQLGRLDRLEFRNGDGLSVFPIGQEQSARLKSLMTARENGEVSGDIQLVFRRLGQSLAAIEEARILKSKSAASSKALSEVQEQLKSIKQELADLREAYDQRSRKVSETQSLIFDLQTSLTSTSGEKIQLEKSLATAESTLAAAQAELKSQNEERIAAQAATRAAIDRAEEAEAALETAQAELKNKSEDLIAAQAATHEAIGRAENAEAALETAQAEVNAAQKHRNAESERAAQLDLQIKATQQALNMEKATRFEETAALTRMLEKARAEVKTAKAGWKTESERAAQLELNISEASQTIESLRFQNEELLNSTSWKMTAPIRTVKTAFSKEK